jgi:hypothetical protein
MGVGRSGGDIGNDISSTAFFGEAKPQRSLAGGGAGVTKPEVPYRLPRPVRKRAFGSKRLACFRSVALPAAGDDKELLRS